MQLRRMNPNLVEKCNTVEAACMAENGLFLNFVEKKLLKVCKLGNDEI